MGNIFFTTNSRKTLCKLLNHLPKCLFKSDYKISLNPALLEWKQELNDHQSIEDWDSALEITFETEITPTDCNTRRKTICGLTYKEEMKRLNEELTNLRKQVELLIAKETKSSKEEIPPPPPLPNIATSTPIDSFKKNVDILKDITNVKLKSVTHKKMSPRKQDVRNDLYEILRRRYAATHSPHSKRSLTFEDDENFISRDSYLTQDVFFSVG